MVNLILFECRKQFWKKPIIIAIVLFSVLNIVKIYNTYDQTSLLSKSTNPSWNSLYWELYEDFSGTITNEKIDKLMSIYHPLDKLTADKTASTVMNNADTYTGNVYNDTYFFRWNFVNPMEYAYMYRNYAMDVVSNAKDNIILFESLGNQYENRKNAAIIDIYNGRTILDYSYTEMYKNYVHYDFSALLVILIFMYVVINIFVSEKETEMDVILLTTKLGGTKTIIAKILTLAIFVFVVCFWFWLVDFISFAFIYRSIEATFSPVYVIENFANSSINISLGKYIVLSNVFKTIGILVFTLVMLLVSAFFKNSLIPFVINLVLTFGFIYIQEMHMGSGHIFLKVINPYVMIVNRELFRKTEFINIFGYPVISYISALFSAIFWSLVCLVGILMIMKKNNIYSKGLK